MSLPGFADTVNQIRAHFDSRDTCTGFSLVDLIAILAGHLNYAVVVLKEIHHVVIYVTLEDRALAEQVAYQFVPISIKTEVKVVTASYLANGFTVLDLTQN